MENEKREIRIGRQPSETRVIIETTLDDGTTRRHDLTAYGMVALLSMKGGEVPHECDDPTCDGREFESRTAAFLIGQLPLVEDLIASAPDQLRVALKRARRGEGGM